MPDANCARNADVIGAIRLALEGAADDETAIRVVTLLCEYAPLTPGDATGPTMLLVDAIREGKVGLRVNVGA